MMPRISSSSVRMPPMLVRNAVFTDRATTGDEPDVVTVVVWRTVVVLDDIVLALKVNRGCAGSLESESCKLDRKRSPQKWDA